MNYSKAKTAIILLLGFVGTQACPTSCKGVTEEEIVLLPNPANCSTYIECVGEVPVVLPCPVGLEWNNKTRLCDYPENANCQERIQETVNSQYTSCEGVPSNIDVLLPNPADCESYIQCVHGQPVVRPCPSGLHWSVTANRCEWPEIANCRRNSCEDVPETEDVLLPNPEDCGTYIQCVHQEPVVRPCPAGLHWNAAQNRCDWPNVANCNVSSQTVVPKRNVSACANVSENEIVLLPVPGNCSAFIECAYGKEVVFLCPKGLKWNDAMKRCDFPDIAQCEEEIKLTPEQNLTRCEGVPEDEIVLLPIPGNCSAFVECANGKEVVLVCPEDLQWNDAEKRCDYPENVQCVEQENLLPSKNWTSCKGVPENETVLFPTPGNCSTYIECTYEKPVVMTCPGNLQWNDAKKQCDYPEVAQCEEQVDLTQWIRRITCEGVPSNIDVLLPNPVDCESYIQCVHGQPVVRPCPSGLHWSVAANRCEWPEIANCRRNSCEDVPETEDVLLPNPEDCGTYIQCIHQEPVVRPCPTGLHWNAVQNRCDWPNVANCNVSSETVVPRRNESVCANVSENEIVLLPVPGNCSAFIECAYGKEVVFLCPKGLKWNDAMKRCDFPDIAQCEEEIKLTPEQNLTRCEGVPEDEIVLLPIPGNCSAFVECANGKEVVFVCPEDLQWNDAVKQCDYPENVQCVEQENLLPSKNWTSCEGVPENETVLFPTPGNCSTYIECTYEKPVVMTCPGNLQWNDAKKQCDYPEVAQCEEQVDLTQWIRRITCEGVPSNIDVLLPNPLDCESYIQCVHGQPVVRPCPSGLHWSVAANRCEWPEIANCRRNSCESVPETEDVLLPNPEDCGTYIQCVHQEPVVRPCPGGLHWNAAQNRCDWPNVANCEIWNP